MISHHHAKQLYKFLKFLIRCILLIVVSINVLEFDLPLLGALWAGFVSLWTLGMLAGNAGLNTFDFDLNLETEDYEGGFNYENLLFEDSSYACGFFENPVCGGTGGYTTSADRVLGLKQNWCNPPQIVGAECCVQESECGGTINANGTFVSTPSCHDFAFRCEPNPMLWVGVIGLGLAWVVLFVLSAWSARQLKKLDKEMKSTPDNTVNCYSAGTLLVSQSKADAKKNKFTRTPWGGVQSYEKKLTADPFLDAENADLTASATELRICQSCGVRIHKDNMRRSRFLCCRRRKDESKEQLLAGSDANAKGIKVHSMVGVVGESCRGCYNLHKFAILSSYYHKDIGVSIAAAVVVGLFLGLNPASENNVGFAQALCFGIVTFVCSLHWSVFVLSWFHRRALKSEMEPMREKVITKMKLSTKFKNRLIKLVSRTDLPEEGRHENISWKVGKITLFYSGEFKDRRMHGPDGTLRWSSIDWVYTGNFSNGTRDGLGVLVSEKQGFRQSGIWSRANAKAVCHGKIEFLDGCDTAAPRSAICRRLGATPGLTVWCKTQASNLIDGTKLVCRTAEGKFCLFEVTPDKSKKGSTFKAVGRLPEKDVEKMIILVTQKQYELTQADREMIAAGAEAKTRES